MKIRLIVLALAILPIAVFAQENFQQCARDATTMGLAAQLRDDGFSPQQTYAMITTRFRMTIGNIPDDVLKGFINVVYFDPEASRMTHDQIQAHEINHCVDQARGINRNYTPLN